jgi:riboflavin kinase/FMN adenylyltransferase
MYDEDIVVRFRKRLRPEIRFDSKEELIGQMEEDKRKTLIYFSSNDN